MGITRSAMKLYFTGQLGGIIQYEVRGQLRSRTRPEHVSNPRTPAQQDHRTRFSLASSFVRSLGHVYKTGYARYNTSLSQRANIVKQVYDNALTPDATIDPLRVLVARGPLARPLDLRASLSDHSLHLSWRRPDSRNLTLSVTIYNYTQALAVTHLDLATSRTSSARIPVPDGWLSDTLYLYAFWRNPSSLATSDSQVLPIPTAQTTHPSLIPTPPNPDPTAIPDQTTPNATNPPTTTFPTPLQAWQNRLALTTRWPTHIPSPPQ